ncbi:MAG: hypothetical protein FWC79_04585 [Oscillospiraceae bacterium]|nr:hypothetical protein [Oscillospiraceae bacterium]
MKRVILIVVIALIILSIIGIIIGFTMCRKEEANNVPISLFDGAYWGKTMTGDTIILSSYEEFIDYFSQFYLRNRLYPILESYDSSFFDSNSLAVIPIIRNHGGHDIENKRATVTGNTVVVRYKIRPWGLQTMAGEGFFLIAEVPKNINEIVVELIGN